LQLARIGKGWQRAAAARMPTATGDIREIVGQPVFVPLFKLYQIYGKIFMLSFGPKQFVIVSDPQMAKHVSRQGLHSWGCRRGCADADADAGSGGACWHAGGSCRGLASVPEQGSGRVTGPCHRCTCHRWQQPALLSSAGAAM
jgi:hypothetical protein